MNHLITLSQKAFLICSLALLTLTYATAQNEEMDSKEEGGEQAPTAQKNDASKAPAEARKVIDTEKQTLALLTQEIDERDVKWLEANGEKFMGLWQADTTGNPFGAVLILHGEGQSVDEPFEINAVRNNLSHHGWATLSIHLPPLAQAKIPPRPEKMEKPSDTEKSMDSSTESTSPDKGAPKADPSMQMSKMNGKKAKDDPEVVSRARLQSAIAFLKEQGQYNIVLVGHGIGATRALKYIDHLIGGKKSNNVKGGKIQRPIRAAVLISARNLIPQTGEHIRQYYNDRSLPILDLYYGDHYLDEIETRQRIKIAKSEGMQHYYQLKVLKPSESDDSDENRLTRRVRGFLNKHAKGVEIEKK